MPRRIPHHLIFTRTRSCSIAGIRLPAAWLANPNPAVLLATSCARNGKRKGKSKPEWKLLAPSALSVKWSVEEDARGKQQLRVNRWSRRTPELGSVVPACNPGDARRRLQWMGLVINDAWRDFEVCEGSAVAGSESAGRYSHSLALFFPAPKMRRNGRFLRGLRRTFSAPSRAAVK